MLRKPIAAKNLLWLMLEIQTNDLSAAHSLLPSIVVSSNQKITSIENPDDNLESLLGYLIREAS